MTQTRTNLYKALYPLVSTGAKLFFKRLQIVGLENLPKDKPVLIVANHQNAMMDPVICCVLMPKQLHWLTRADVFKKPAISKLLHQFNMLPVYRERDKVGDLAGKNDATFQECYARLEAQAIVCMFPEGTHRGKKQLHLPLKKGSARLALGAFDFGEKSKELVIVPVGLDYANYYTYRSDLLVKVGKPIAVAEYWKQAQQDQARAITSLMNDQRTGLSSVMIDIQDEESYEALLSLRELSDALCEKTSLSSEFDQYQKLCQNWVAQDSKEQWNQKANRFIDLKNAGGITKSNERSVFWQWIAAPLLLLLGLPYALLAALVFSPMYYGIEKFVLNTAKDPLFYNSLRMSFWTFLTPIYLLIIGCANGLLIQDWVMGGIIVATVVLCGLISLEWWSIFAEWKNNIRLRKYLQTTKGKEWKQLRDELKTRIKQLV